MGAIVENIDIIFGLNIYKMVNKKKDTIIVTTECIIKRMAFEAESGH